MKSNLASKGVVQLCITLFVLPDGRFVLQRRTEDAPYAAGLLGQFGGHVEPGETVAECVRRELREETSLDVDDLEITEVADFTIPAGPDYPKDRHFYLTAAPIPDMNFSVFEGDRAEAYTLDELRARHDLNLAARHVADKILK